jgi:prolyl-tRNA synthetase
LHVARGIEVGNIFQLGTKYSTSMNATFTTEEGTESPFIMGCYGIGTTRVAAAAIERHHDDYGILWPASIAPFKIAVVVANMSDETQKQLGQTVYEALHQLYPNDVLLDDRDERAGVKFKDADLMGFPIRITIGKLAGEGLIEVKHRTSKDVQTVGMTDLAQTIKETLTSWNPLN